MLARHLEIGDTIAVFSPSSPATKTAEKRYHRGKAFLEEKGEEVMGECKIPVLAQFDCCHTHPMLTMPIGCQVELDSEHQKVTLLERALL